MCLMYILLQNILYWYFLIKYISHFLANHIDIIWFLFALLNEALLELFEII